MQHVTQSGVDCSRLRHVMSCDVFGGGGPRGAWNQALTRTPASGVAAFRGLIESPLATARMLLYRSHLHFPRSLHLGRIGFASPR